MKVIEDVERGYPFIVIRWMATVYGRQEIESGLSRLEMISKIKKQIKKDGFRRCLVISKTKGIYIEKDGSVKIMTPPCGGIRLDSVEMVNKK